MSIKKLFLLILLCFSNIFCLTNNLYAGLEDDFRNLQRGLTLCGFECEVTGKFDRQTQVALQDFKAEYICGFCDCRGDLYQETLEEKVAEIQVALNCIGYQAGIPNGICSEQTLNAAKKFQTEHGFTPNGMITSEVYELLKTNQQLKLIEKQAILDSKSSAKSSMFKEKRRLLHDKYGIN